MRIFLKLLPLVWLGLTANPAHASHTHAQLLLSEDTARAGGTIWAGVDLKMDSGWHTDWKNPGVAGIATKIRWQLPPGITAGDTQWPLPEKIPLAGIITYGYSNRVVLLAPLKLAADLKPGPLDLKAKVSWLECKTECIPGGATVGAVVNIGSKTKISTDAKIIDRWKSRTPQPGSQLTAHARWGEPASGDKRPLVLEWRAPEMAAHADFFPNANDHYEIGPVTENLTAKPGVIRLCKTVRKISGNWPKEISGVIVMDIGDHRQGFEVKIQVAQNKAGVLPAQRAVASVGNIGPPLAPAGGMPALPLMLLCAFIGGLILNIMPCVLPVIALKILGFITHAQQEPRQVRVLGLIYVLGVLGSFLALAAVVIGVKVAGHQAGWGMQFGSPIFIVVLTTLVMLVALNLFGVFDVDLGGHALSAAGQFVSKPGAPGAFFNGVLATALATPCTAPILATALGFAFLQTNPVIIILIFLFVGLGLAAPYAVLSWTPTWLKFLPKPGAWMEKFKIAMGFPMLATAVWLFNLAYDDYGKNVLWLGIFLVIVALAAWVFGEFVQRGRTGKVIAAVITLILLIGGYAFALEDQLHWRETINLASTSYTRTDLQHGIHWQSWSPQAVAKAQGEGRPVLVDFTADWCLTCQVNKTIAIEVPSVRKKLREINDVTLVGDYTHFPNDITAELRHFGRAGVPLVLVYPKRVDAQVIVLPQILTPSIVLKALNQAAQ